METKNLELTPELREQLQGFVGFHADAEFPYVLKVLRLGKVLEVDKAGKVTKRGKPADKRFWSVFTLRSKDGVELAEFEDAVMGRMKWAAQGEVVDYKPDPGSRRLADLEKGIVAIKNFLLEDGVLNYKDGRLTIVGKKNITQENCPVREVIRYLPGAVQVELQDAIAERNTLSEEELQGLEL